SRCESQAAPRALPGGGGTGIATPPRAPLIPHREQADGPLLPSPSREAAGPGPAFPRSLCMSKSRRLFSRGNLLYLAALGLLGFGLAGGLSEPGEPAAPQAPGAPQPMADAAPAPGTAHPLDEPLRLIARAKQVFAGVRDYTCTLIKQERIDG